MASSWTVALTYEVMKKLAAQLKDYDPNYADHFTNHRQRHSYRFLINTFCPQEPSQDLFIWKTLNMWN